MHSHSNRDKHDDRDPDQPKHHRSPCVQRQIQPALISNNIVICGWLARKRGSLHRPSTGGETTLRSSASIAVIILSPYEHIQHGRIGHGNASRNGRLAPDLPCLQLILRFARTDILASLVTLTEL